VASCILAANAAGRSFSKFASLLLCVHAVNLGTRHWWFHIIVVVDFVTFAGLFKISQFAFGELPRICLTSQPSNPAILTNSRQRNRLVQMARLGAIERRRCGICAERVPAASSA
jgi:hypothetical protein